MALLKILQPITLGAAMVDKFSILKCKEQKPRNYLRDKS